MFFRVVLFGALALPALVDSVRSAEFPAPSPQIHMQIDDARRVTLYSTTPPWARPENDLGKVPDSMTLLGLQLALRRPAAQERLLEKLMQDQLDRNSPRYHKWITASEYGHRFGVAVRDVNKILAWLTSRGFKAKADTTSRMRIDFAGTAGQVRDTFHTEIHRVRVHGEAHVTNMSDPQIPAALAPVIAGIAWLNDFRPKPQYTGDQSCEPFDASGNKKSTCYWVVPADLWTIYNFPVSAYNGTGQTIAVMEGAPPLFGNEDWCNFRTEFLEPTCSSQLFSVVNPGGCTAPSGYSSAEVALDPEWASAAAPGANIVLAACADQGTNPGYLIALEKYVDQYTAQIISMSFGFCEAALGLGGDSVLNTTYQQAAAEGFSVFVAAGDAGAAVCDWGSGYGYATQGIAVSGYASSSYVVAVGGTTFADWALGTEATYWNSQNGQYWNSARSYIPEIPWNSSCGNALTAGYYGYARTYGSNGFCNSGFPNHTNQFLAVLGGSGGPSACGIPAPGGGCAGYPKPSWQNGIVGNPGDGVRDIPDVSIFAGGEEWGHKLVYCNEYLNAICTNGPGSWATSFSAPIFAGIQALIDQRVGEHIGNPNPTYYALAKAEYGQNGSSSCLSVNAAGGNHCVFYDVSSLSSGDSTTVVPCKGNINCYLDGAKYGVLSSNDSNYAPAYTSNPGWDFTTGIGSPNVTNLVNAWPIP